MQVRPFLIAHYCPSWIYNGNMRAVTEFKREDGATSYRIRFRHNKKHTSETFPNRERAERFARLLDDLGSQKALDQIYAEDQQLDVPTLNDFAAKHIASLTRITDGTRVSYERIYKRVWRDPLGYLPLHHIDRYKIADVINALVGDGKSDKTIANAHGLLAGILNGAIIDGHIGINPCRATKLPRNTEHDSEEIQFLTQEEYQLLRSKMVEHFRPLIDTLAGTGMRWGEAEALQVKSINFRARTVSITRAAKWNASKSTRAFGPPKTRKSRRTITLPDSVVAILGEQVKGKGRDDLVFTMPKGGQLRHATFYDRYWKPAAESTEITPRPKVHGLRHSHVSWLMAAHVPLAVIQARLGHESITTTVNVYGHLLPESQVAAAEAANLVFGAPARAIES
jgi:integrase